MRGERSLLWQGWDLQSVVLHMQFYPSCWHSQAIKINLTTWKRILFSSSSWKEIQLFKTEPHRKPIQDGKIEIILRVWSEYRIITYYQKIYYKNLCPSILGHFYVCEVLSKGWDNYGLLVDFVNISLVDLFKVWVSCTQGSRLMWYQTALFAW